MNIQDTDKTVRVECAFTAEDQTVSFRPTAGGRDDGGGISVTWVIYQLFIFKNKSIITFKRESWKALNLRFFKSSFY